MHRDLLFVPKHQKDDNIVEAWWLGLVLRNRNRNRRNRNFLPEPEPEP